MSTGRAPFGYNYGIGVVRSGSWILQNPLVGGYSATEAYLPSQKVSVSVAATFLPGAFDCNGVYPNSSDTVFRAIGDFMAPNDRPPTVPTQSKACWSSLDNTSTAALMFVRKDLIAAEAGV